MSATCTGGQEAEKRMLPSFSSTVTVPVAAMAMLQPVMPASAARNFSRRLSRAMRVISGISLLVRPSFAAKSADTCSLDTCRAGARMCEGF